MSNTFAAIDFETAKGHHICSVGIVTFKDGVIVDEFHALIQPPNNDYNWHNQQVHGFTENDTRFSPNFRGVCPEIKKLVLIYVIPFFKGILNLVFALFSPFIHRVFIQTRF